MDIRVEIILDDGEAYILRDVCEMAFNTVDTGQYDTGTYKGDRLRNIKAFIEKVLKKIPVDGV